MKFMSSGYRHRGAGGEAPAWIDGWVRSDSAWALRALRSECGLWTHRAVPPLRLIKARMFEPSTPGIRILGTENRSFDIPDLSSLAPLLEPREILGGMFPGAAISNAHTIYVAETEAGRLYFPALLLIDELWFWSLPALRTLLIPNSLDVVMGKPTQVNDGLEVTVSVKLASENPSETGLRRIAWLSQAADARTSWHSVLTNAFRNRLDVALPRASMSGWVWGAQLSSGLMACELSSVELKFELPGAGLHIRVGSVRYPVCRPASSELGLL